MSGPRIGSCVISYGLRAGAGDQGCEKQKAWQCLRRVAVHEIGGEQCDKVEATTDGAEAVGECRPYTSLCAEINQVTGPETQAQPKAGSRGTRRAGAQSLRGNPEHQTARHTLPQGNPRKEEGEGAPGAVRGAVERWEGVGRCQRMHREVRHPKAPGIRRLGQPPQRRPENHQNTLSLKEQTPETAKGKY